MINKIIKLYKKYKEVINYLIFGVLSTVINLAIYYGLTITILNPNNAIHLQIANIISWTGAVIFAYITNRKFVFESRNNNIIKECTIFFGARIITLIMDIVIMFIGVTILKQNDKIFKIISQIVVIVSNYLFSKIFVFKKNNKVAKTLIIIFIILLCTGCNNTEKELKSNEEIIEDNKEEVEEEIWIDDNPIKVGLYNNSTLIDTYTDSFTIYTDIISLECYYTNDNSIITGNYKDVWNNYYNNYENIEKYKIGYHIVFDTANEKIDKYIYRPSDVLSFFNYIQIYLYDDIHQDSSWYSHIEDSEYTDNTLLTSIKLTASTNIDEVNNIEVTVFTYDGEADIDSDGKYIGNSYYKSTIKRG